MAAELVLVENIMYEAFPVRGGILEIVTATKAATKVENGFSCKLGWRILPFGLFGQGLMEEKTMVLLSRLVSIENRAMPSWNANWDHRK